MTYDELYGIDIDKYCLAHNTTLDDIIHKSQIDIELLNNNLKRLLIIDKKNLKNKVRDREGILLNHMNTLHALIKKKQAHINKMQDWKNGI